MFLLAKHAPDARCGVIIDVGSASVAAAIVVSEIGDEQPKVVWTYTERCPIEDEPDTISLAKKVTAALLAVSMEVSQKGLPALAAHDTSLRVGYMHVSVAAPWSYTVPKRVRYQKEEPFLVTNQILNDLITTAEQETTASHAASPMFEQLGLEVIASDTAYVTANGYAIKDPVGQHTTELVLVRKLSICQKRLVDTIRELHESLVPRAKLAVCSFIDQMQQQVLSRTVTTGTYGLIDISGDATEVGIVVDGVLTSVVSNTWGHYAVARQIAQVTNEPLMSAFARLQELTGTKLNCATATQQAASDEILAQFSQELAAVLSRAALTAELPAHFIVHSDTGLQTFARSMTIAAVSTITHTDSATVTTVSEKLISIVDIPETRLALSVAVFHSQQGE